LFPNLTYYETAQYLYDRTVAANAANDYFPLWGTCMGFQLLNLLTANDSSVLSLRVFDSDDLPLPLELTHAANQSRLFGSAPSTILSIFTSQNVTVNLHHDGVKTSVFASNSRLTSFYRLLSVNRDRKGLQFVSSIEGINVPIYGTQFHPERNQFDWLASENILHNADAILAMQYLANFFVAEARKSSHSFPADLLEPYLIYNYNPFYLGDSYQLYFI